MCFNTDTRPSQYKPCTGIMWIKPEDGKPCTRWESMPDIVSVSQGKSIPLEGALNHLNVVPLVF
ncbi:hypothetical protein DPMN_053106 [Dreissena polymorpha]|uniref:Uncharacterized protein n=1 Tax=Dreissena polymorpha TaxID=45954 RepID=A0A9D4CMP1_DREPO|nr:hypothetical protein DPMN_053106 [Dreissena polymorpha]